MPSESAMCATSAAAEACTHVVHTQYAIAIRQVYGPYIVNGLEIHVSAGFLAGFEHQATVPERRVQADRQWHLTDLLAAQGARRLLGDRDQRDLDDVRGLPGDFGAGFLAATAHAEDLDVAAVAEDVDLVAVGV
ncbi:hypothetical protein AB0M48_32990 [Lentzea sp. NPDC051208]|uniref:hypothetical protein n=1 Tax=Lentzea sp. NPDC051208 TaxID=3154642 RepID=UPI003446127C